VQGEEPNQHGGQDTSVHGKESRECQMAVVATALGERLDFSATTGVALIMLVVT
jgi:hypothetical protein